MANQNDIMRYYQEKIRHIEDQIKELDRHVQELDAFEKRELSRNIPYEYKMNLHSAVSKARNDAGIVKGKAIATANNLKQRVHAFMQKPKN